MSKKRKLFLFMILALICFVGFKSNVLAYVDENNISCAALDGAKIDKQLPSIVSTVILLLQIAVPVIIIIYGTIDLVKGVMAQKDDEIAAGRKTFGKRVLAGIIVFFVIAAVKLVVSFGAKDNYGSIFSCAECFIKGPDSTNCQNA
jgi:hypothetical protein